MIYELDIGNGQIVRRTDHLASEELLEMNQAQRDANDSIPWGEGKVAARIPLPEFFSKGWSDAAKTGDSDHMKWLLNHSDNAHWRTKRGTI